MMEESIDQGMNLTKNELKVTDCVQTDLITAAKWGKFLAIVGFVTIGLMFMGSLFLLIASTTPFIGGQFAIMGVIYLVMGIIFVFPTLHLLRFSNRMLSGISSGKQTDFELGIEYLRSLFKFIGIYTIVILGMYILIFLTGFLGVIFG